eukprot:Hpha_TRINITY_DN3321_c0_g1::TRINITY_DN3321_c0_g1_i1::g.172319::m.172319
MGSGETSGGQLVLVFAATPAAVGRAPAIRGGFHEFRGGVSGTQPSTTPVLSFTLTLSLHLPPTISTAAKQSPQINAELRLHPNTRGLRVCFGRMLLKHPPALVSLVYSSINKV